LTRHVTGISKKAPQKEPKRKAGLHALTAENLREFHEQEESWEDPKDYGTQLPIFNAETKHLCKQ